jgi:hydroxymethylbilane synthase
MSNQPNTIVIGSRGSQLALWQSQWVKKELETAFPKLLVRIDIIKTTGDNILDSPLSKIGDKGLFTKEIEHALLERKIDLAVHSLKDLPTQLPKGLLIGAITEREDIRDVFIGHPKKSYKKLSDISSGGTIATGSLRRRSQLLNRHPHLNIIDLRGNLNTRFQKLDASDWDGMILAKAGVVRLGFTERISDVISLEEMLPAVGQGALGIELRQGDTRCMKFVRSLASEATTIATSAERSLLRTLEGGCQVPIGAHGRIEKNVLKLDALIGSLDGKKIIRGKILGEPGDAETLGMELAETLYKSGGKEILEQIRAA